MYRSMAEQDIREDQMTITNTVDYVRGLKGKDSVLIAPGDLLSALFNIEVQLMTLILQRILVIIE